ncbi:hypothetical protein X750_09395 [Mesorhizobium sp. LNJC394B00]|nr:hypothetical protein X750_09395 [Mesorhizobium sp. LNJC394B00]
MVKRAEDRQHYCLTWLSNPIAETTQELFKTWLFVSTQHRFGSDGHVVFGRQMQDRGLQQIS